MSPAPMRIAVDSVSVAGPCARRSYSRASRNDTQGQYCQKHFHCFMMPHRLSPLFDVRIGSLQKAACEDLSN